MSEAPPQHTAFRAQLAAKLSGKAACVEAWQKLGSPDDRVLAGLQDGTLMILAPPEAASAAQSTPDVSLAGQNSSWRIVQAFKSFGSNRSLTQLQVSASRSLLLSLGDQGISVHRLPAFQLTCQASRTRCGRLAY